MDTEKIISAAEKEISTILAKLESGTGTLIDSISVHDIEVTACGDDRPKWMRLPGTRLD